MITARIVRKSKEGVALKVKGVGITNLSWDDFNRGYDIDKNDKFKAIMKPEYEEKGKKANEIADSIIINLMMSNSPNPKASLAGLYGLGEKMKEFCDIMECSLAEGSMLIRKKMEGFVSAGLNEGIGFGKPYDKFMNKSQKKHNWENHKKIEEEQKLHEKVENDMDSTDAYHYTLGDALKSK